MKITRKKLTFTAVMSLLAGILSVCSFGLLGTPKQVSTQAAQSPYGALIQEFQVVSDTHVHATGALNHDVINPRVQNFFSQVASLSPNSNGVFINGDVVDGHWDYRSESFLGQFENLHTLITNGGVDKTKVYAVSGNHTFHAYRGDANRDANCINTFLTGTKGLGNDKGVHDGQANGNGSTGNNMYYYVDVGGSRFIMLSSLHVEDGSDMAYLGDTQLAWFSNALAGAPQGRPIYVFLHQGLKDTMAGTAGMSAIEPTEEAYLRTELAKYKRAVIFGGHTHAALGADSFYQGNGVNAINTSTVGYDNNQAYFVYEYENAVVFKGRNIATGTWVSDAEFVFKFHTLERVEAKSAQSNVEAGNIEYWHCTGCGKYFSDEQGNTEIDYEDTIVNYTYANTALNGLNENVYSVKGVALRHVNAERSKAFRYRVTMQSSAYQALKNAGEVETGILLYPYQALNGKPLTANTANVVKSVMTEEWSQAGSTAMLENTAVLTEMPLNVDNGTEIAVVAYVKLGNEYYYSQLQYGSLAYVATEVIDVQGTTQDQTIALRDNYCTVLQRVDFGNGSTTTYNRYYGDKLVEPSAPTKDDYTFDGWSMNGVAVNFATDTVGSDCLITATWRPTEYTVTFAGEGNLPSPITYNVENAGEVELPTPTHDTLGYGFDGWYIGNDKITTLAGKKGAITLTAQWSDRSNELNTDDAVGFTVAGGTLTAPTSMTSHVYTYGGGKAFIATVDLTMTKNASDSGMGFTVKDSDGNTLNFMFVNWAESTVCAQVGYGYGDFGVGRYKGIANYYNFSGYTNNVTINVGIAYDGNAFTFYENGLYRTRFTIAELNASMTNANGKFTANETFTVGLFGFNGKNTGGTFENFTANYYTSSEIASMFTADLEVYKGTERVEFVENVAIATGAQTFKPLSDFRTFDSDQYKINASASTMTATLGSTKQTFKIVYEAQTSPVYTFSKGGANYEYLVNGTNVYLQADATVGADGQRFNGFVLSQGDKSNSAKKLSFVFNHTSVMVQHAYGWDEDGFRYNRGSGNATAQAGDKAYMDAIEVAQGTGNRTGVIASGDILKAASATTVRIELNAGQVKVYAGGTLYVTVDLATLNTGLSLGFDMSASFDVGLYGFDCNTGNQDVTFENVSYGNIEA